MKKSKLSVRRSARTPLESIWFPFTSSEDLAAYPPVVIERGRGAYLYDSNGKALLDAVGSWWVNNLGHCNPRINAAVRDQLKKLDHVMMAGFVSPPTVQLAGLLQKILPKQLGRFFFSDDGSTAVEVALKIALQYWQLKGEKRMEFVSFSGAYHGDTLGAIAVGTIKGYHTVFHERFKQFRYADSPYCYRCPVGKNKESCKAECMDSLEKVIRTGEKGVAAVVIEPMVQAAVGMRVYPPKVLKRIFAICRRYGVLTIADEVAVGLGRTGKMVACSHAHEVPDIICLAKGLTGGYMPMAVTAVQEHIYGEFRGDFQSGRIFNHGHSFTGNPLASAAAVAAMGLLLELDIPQSLGPVIDYFHLQLEKHFGGCEFVGDIRRIGMLGAIELVQDRATKKPFAPEKRAAFHICRAAIASGVLLRPLGNVIYFMPPYVITRGQIDKMVEITAKSIKAVTDHA